MQSLDSSRQLSKELAAAIVKSRQKANEETRRWKRKAEELSSQVLTLTHALQDLAKQPRTVEDAVAHSWSHERVECHGEEPARVLTGQPCKRKAFPCDDHVSCVPMLPCGPYHSLDAQGPWLERGQEGAAVASLGLSDGT